MSTLPTPGDGAIPPSSPTSDPSPFHAVPFGGLAVAALVLLAGILVTRHGPAVTPDSVQYLSTAGNLARGNGAWSTITPLEISAREVPFAPWPPLFPALLGLCMRAGLPLLESARWVNLAFLVLTLAPLAALARRLAGPGAGTRTVALHALLFYPYLLSAFVWSEPMFLCLSTASLYFVGRGLDRDEGFPREFLLAGILAGAAMLTRYIGIVLIATSAFSLVVLGMHRPWRHVTRNLTWYLLPAALPNGAWLLRNSILTGHFFGEARPEGWFSQDRILLDAGRTLLQDGVAPIWRGGLQWGWAGAACGALGAILLAILVGRGLRTARFPRLEDNSGLGLVLAIYGVGFVAAMLLIVGRIGLDPVNTRYLSPVYPVFLVLAVVAVRTLVFSDRRRPARARTMALAAGVALLAVPQVAATLQLALRAGHEERTLTRPYWTSVWPDEELRLADPGLVRIRELAGPTGLVLSNEWEIVGVTTGIPVKPLPEADASCFPQCVLDFPGALVAVREGTRTWRVTSAQMQTLAEETGAVRSLGRAGDWALFRVRPGEIAGL